MENTKRLLIFGIVFLLMISLASATVTRSGTSNVITYATTSTGATKGYWAVEETITGCTMTSASCSVTNAVCGYVGGIIKVTGYTAATGGSMPTSIPVTIVGNGACTLNNGKYVESFSPNPSSTQTSISGSINLNMVATCNTAADSNCDGCVSDPEFPIAVNKWKTQSGITDADFPSVVLNWKNRAGC